MKSLIKPLALMSILTASSQVLAATETLRVAVVFDKNTTNYSFREVYKIATKQVKYLNQSMKNSGLSNDIKYQLVVYKTISFSKYFDTYDDLRKKYLSAAESNLKTGVASLPLNKVSKDSHADVVLAIVDPWLEGNICGSALILPNKVSPVPVNELLEFADTGIVFITDKSSCYNDPMVVSHEVGHTFGLYHGVAVQTYTGEEGHFSTHNAIHSEANGFGKSNGSKYGTIMTGYYLDAGAPDNTYSNKNQYDCGLYGQICGDATSNAVSVLKQYKAAYNKRGNWYN